MTEQQESSSFYADDEEKSKNEIISIQAKTMVWLRGLYQTANDEEKRMIEVCMVGISADWADHNEILPDWDHSCWCDECKICM